MAYQVPWNDYILSEFSKTAMLSEEEVWIMQTRICGWSRTKQCQFLNISESALDKKIALLKKKYDFAQKINPNLPPRKSSKQETWMDEN